MSRYLFHIAVVIPWSINADSRAQRTLKVLEGFGQVDVFYIPRTEKDKVIWDQDSVTNFIMVKEPERNFMYKVYANSFFYKVYDHFIPKIIEQQKHYSAVYIHDLVSGRIGLELKKRFNCKLIYDIHDLYIETINQQFPVSTSGKPKTKYFLVIKLMKMIGYRLEKKLMSKSELIFTVNQSCQEYLSERYGKMDIKYFHNYPEYHEKPTISDEISKIAGFSQKKNICVYIGVLNRGRRLEEIIHAAEFLEEQNVLVVIGDGNLKDKMVKISEQNNTYNRKIYFVDSISYSNLFNVISEAKLGIMLLDPINRSKEYAFANKITEYMLCGIPPLLSDHVEHRKLIEYADVGYLISNYAPEVIGTKINEIMNNEEERQKKSEVARSAFEKKYNWNMEKKELVKEVSMLFEKLKGGIAK